MKKLPKKELKKLFVTAVAKDGGVCADSNPFILKLRDARCQVFIKNISPAYYKNYPDITRVQLPSSDRFKIVIDSILDFIILGYDSENDVFVSWDPSKIKERLNTKSNVSLYSRLSLQSEVVSNQFKQGYLSNGDKIVLFKRQNLIDFFNNYVNLHVDNYTSKGEDTSVVNEKKSEEIHDVQEFTRIIAPLLEENKVLKAVSLLTERYKNDHRYKGYKFKDWFAIVKEYYERTR